MKIKRKIAAVVLAVMALPLFSACDAEKGITITESAAKSVQTEKYETADFSITIPKGWKVTTGGTNIYHTIRVSDPDEPLNGMFILRHL